eukprot:scaffold4200_cov60-Phaeocystis_antarctica.AAC.2
MLESLAAVAAAEQLLHSLLAPGLPRLVILDARGGCQLQPSEEDLVVAGGARVARAQSASTGSCGSRQADQIEHCLRRCQHLRITVITSLKQVPLSVASRIHRVEQGAIVEQQRHHLLEAPAVRHHQRAAAARALFEQQLHHLRVAVNERPHQRGPAEHVLLIDRRALVEQQLHHLRVALAARPHQRGHAVIVLLVDRRITVEQLLHQLRVAGTARVVKWAHCALERMSEACQVLPRRPVAGLCRSLVASAPSSQSRRVLATAQRERNYGPLMFQQGAPKDPLSTAGLPFENKCPLERCLDRASTTYAPNVRYRSEHGVARPKIQSRPAPTEGPAPSSGLLFKTQPRLQ